MGTTHAEGVAVSAIRADVALQPRVSLDIATIAEYAAAMRDGATFPPVVVFHDGAAYWLADGFHRVAAARQAEAETIAADVRQGTRRDALLFAVGANADHGLRRTNADKRRAVEILLADEEWAGWSDSEIARRCAVSQPFASKVRGEGASHNRFEMPTRRTVQRGGVVYQQNTAAIGRRPEPPKPAEPVLDPLAGAPPGPWGDDVEAADDYLRHLDDHTKDQIREAGYRSEPREAYEPEYLTEIWGPGTGDDDPEPDADPPFVDAFEAVPAVVPEDPAAIEALRRKATLAEASAIRSEQAAVRRQERIEKLTEIPEAAPLASVGLHHVVLADPPWRYEHAVSTSREIENQYPTMSIEEIRALPVNDVVAADAVLFMWATSPKLAEAMGVIEAWGFTYRTCMVWVKDRIGMGYYARQRHELLLIASRGDGLPMPEPDARPDSVIEAPRGEHSAKPPHVHDLIAAMYPDPLRRLEMFSRQPREGWNGWGNQSNRGAA